ncbi:6808_t:CDS:10 [Funneliformis geosporum]|uniref:454_t:CDS:1 n=1 Tax=Funneliformis geosporum TaxID=1117311 RepID=A0A9W4SI85_9GLOM|nr:454_t:CDS:10 [Funneliformis geosporum]CAI2171147.1 6808_t:CDS:10 [Funneliformis geosporum]
MVDLKSTSSILSYEKKLEQQHKQSRQNVGVIAILFMSFRTLGVIYGDIGTSPLYVLSAIFPDAPGDARDVIGICSLIIWSLTIVPMIKYVFIVLRADDNGEGGTFALYSLLNKYSGLSVHGESRSDDSSIVRYDNSSIHSLKQPNMIARSKFIQNALLIIVLLGASLVMSDGLLTPAVSVISAVEGIAIKAPSLKAFIVPISCVIIVILFLAQQFGTKKVGDLFAPIVFLWLMTIASTGIWNITKHPEIMRSFNPYYIFDYFIRNKGVGFNSLGGVLLSITGVEALYADLGHFNRISIQLSFPLYVYPTLTLAYLGQGARIILDPSIVKPNAFWNSVPENDFVFWITFVFATLATIIASQAMISATFSLIYQAVQLECFPRVKVIHTSKVLEGQIYIPEINYFLMVVIVIICIVFKESANLTNAYGVAVAFLLIFGIIDLAFLISTLRKVKEGGWFTLLLAIMICLVMIIWKWGSTLKFQHALKSKTRLENIFINDDEPDKGDEEVTTEKEASIDPISKKAIDERERSNEIVDGDSSAKGISFGEIKTRKEINRSQIRLASSGFQVSRLPGIGMFYSEVGLGVPLTFRHFIQHFPAVPQTLIFISIRPVAIPYVGDDDRLVVRKVNYDGCYNIIARYGYMEKVSQGQDFVKRMIESIRKFDPTHEGLLENSNHVTYVVGQQYLHPKLNTTWLKKLIIYGYVFLVNNSRQLYGNWNIPIEDVVDVGMKIAL